MRPDGIYSDAAKSGSIARQPLAAGVLGGATPNAVAQRSWVTKRLKANATLLHAHASSLGSFVGLAHFFLGRFALFRVALNIVVEFLLRRLAFFPRCVVRG